MKSNNKINLSLILYPMIKVYLKPAIVQSEGKICLIVNYFESLDVKLTVEKSMSAAIDSVNRCSRNIIIYRSKIFELYSGIMCKYLNFEVKFFCNLLWMRMHSSHQVME